MVNLKDRSEDTMRHLDRPQAIHKTLGIVHPCLLTIMTFSLLATTPAFATTEFQGSLNSVSIIDAAGANAPPKATFSYTQEGDTFTFDASGSTDSDGTITEYKWDFGEGTVGSGVQINHQFATNDLPVTLTVVDNLGGITLTQVIARSSAWYIEDNFTSLDPWTSIGRSSAMIVSANKGTVSNTWSTAAQSYTASPLLGSDQTAQVLVELQNTTNKGGVILRYDPTWGAYYSCFIRADNAYINYFDGTKTVYLASASGLSFNTTSLLNVSCTATGDTFTLYVDGNEYLKKLYTGASTAGRYVGSYVGNDGDKAYISQFRAKSE